jgi:hypothetical protein
VNTFLHKRLEAASQERSSNSKEKETPKERDTRVFREEVFKVTSKRDRKQ